MSRERTTSSKPRTVESTAFCISPISNASLTSRISARKPRSSSSRSAVTWSASAASTPASWPRTTRTGPVPPRSVSATVRTSAQGNPYSVALSVRLCRRPTHSSPWPCSQNSPFSRSERGSRYSVARWPRAPVGSRTSTPSSVWFPDRYAYSTEARKGYSVSLDRVLRLPAGTHQTLAGEARRQPLAPLGELRRLCDGLQIVQLGVAPAGLHVRGQLVGDARVQAVLPLLDRLLVSGVCHVCLLFDG